MTKREAAGVNPAGRHGAEAASRPDTRRNAVCRFWASLIDVGCRLGFDYCDPEKCPCFDPVHDGGEC